MSDITKLFKATVKTLRSRSKPNTSVDKSILQTKPTALSPFASKAHNVVKTISQLHAFLLKHRSDYVNSGSLSSQTSNLTDVDRDQIDSDAEVLIKTCSEAISAFKVEALTGCTKEQTKQHRTAVLHMIETYLKAVCKVYSTQRAIRVKKAVDKKRIGRLAPERSVYRSPKFDRRKNFSEEKQLAGNLTEVISSESTSSPAGEDDNLSPEEIQLFEEENDALLQELNNVVDEVKQIEGKVVEISKLQEIFADKVLEQEKDIDLIADKVVGSTENLKEANQDIREAMRNNAGLRVWILFILIVLTFSLLFLDWYST